MILYSQPLQCCAAPVSCQDRLPQHLDFVCDISNALDVPALALTSPSDLVSQSSHFRSSDLSRLQFDLSSSTRQVQELNGSFRVIERWCGCLRHVRCDVMLDLLVLILISS